MIKLFVEPGYEVKKPVREFGNAGIDFFIPEYSCKLCNDTGYFVDNNQIMCTCLKQKLLNIQYNKSNISSLENENFDNFNINIFSDEKDEKKYNSNISPNTTLFLTPDSRKILPGSLPSWHQKMHATSADRPSSPTEE